jgi:phosphohistidine swiveling domain-containing protein
MNVKKSPQSIHDLKHEDFAFTFESQGTTFFFQDLVIRYYMPCECVMLFNGESVRLFSSRDFLEQVKKEGLSRSPDDVRRMMGELTALIEQAAKEKESFKSKERFSREDAERMLEMSAAICRGYEYFDPYNWEGAYERSETDPRMKENVDLIQGFKNVVREQLNPIYFEKEGYLNVLMSKKSKQFDIPEHKLDWYEEQELLGLFDGRQPADEVLDARRQAYVVYRDSQGWVHPLTGNEAVAFISRFDIGAKASVRQEIIKGKTAHHTGEILQGKVKIVSRDYADPAVTKRRIAEMQEGEVLVSETTDPEMMGALKKASAIITDVGGMLSHAAITARELKKPCIVMTGNASKILKDGDMVEVDTEQGIVKILS